MSMIIILLLTSVIAYLLWKNQALHRELNRYNRKEIR